ncbi:MAG: amidohydrolase, partial [Bacteroidota bacterium]
MPRSLVMLWLGAFSFLSCAPSDQPTADQAIVLINAAIYTVNPEQPWAEAIAFEDGIILAVGDEREVLEAAGPDAFVVDLEGRMAMPGVQDPHLHVLEAGINDDLCLLPSLASLSRYERLIQQCAEQQPGDGWVRAAGVATYALLEQRERPLDVLDRAVPDRPVLILDDLGHGAWANSRAFEAVGYTEASEDPPGGILHLDAATGRLSGIVLENAQQALRTASLPPTPDNLDAAYDGLLDALDILARNGITSVSDAGGYWTRGNETVWQRAEDEGTLTVRASNALYVFPDVPIQDQLDELAARFSDEPDALLRFNQAKLYVDGILDQGTSALLSPYTRSFGYDQIPEDGFLYFPAALLNEYARELDAAGFQLHFHVTGDRGARLALNAIEAAQLSNGTQDARHRLTHLYLVDEQDRPRFADLGVVADFQLAPSSIHPSYVTDIEGFIGRRSTQLLPAASLRDAGATLALSSDWDADVLSPFVKMEAVLSRPEEGIERLEDAIQLMTLNAAYLLHHDDSTGSLEPGKLADLIVLDRNLFGTPLRDIASTRVLLTLLGGEV